MWGDDVTEGIGVIIDGEFVGEMDFEVSGDGNTVINLVGFSVGVLEGFLDFVGNEVLGLLVGHAVDPMGFPTGLWVSEEKDGAEMVLAKVGDEEEASEKK